MRLPIALALALAPAAAHAGDDEIVPDPKAVRAAREANLEPERQREGLAIGVAFGPSLQAGSGIDEASGAGGSFNLRIGTSATDRLAWFFDIFATATPREGDTTQVKVNRTDGIAFGAQYMLLPAFWLRGAAGFTTLTIKSEEATGELIRHGVGGLAGGGVDIYRYGRFALSGQLTVVTGFYKDGMVTSAIAQLGLTWY